MVEKLFSVNDIMARYQLKSRQTAAKRMREMAHMEHPLMVTEKAIMDWEARRTVLPPEEIMRRKLERRLRA